MSAEKSPSTFALWTIAALLLAGFSYWFALGSNHAATNGDELLYAQISRVTAESGHWLPLQSPVEKHRNTKPPALFWQGMASTHWASLWDLWHLRYPNVLYTFAIAAMTFVVGRRLGRDIVVGLLAAAIYLSFFGIYRYGRVFLTSAPEAFWLFLPVFILFLRKDRPNVLPWFLAFVFGLISGVALLYKSFALMMVPAGLLSWWTFRARDYRFKSWLLQDVPKIALMCILSLAVFSLWYFLDPQRQLLLADFVFKENLGKFDTGGGNYFLRMFWGDSSLWRNIVSYPINAGLMAPAVIGLFWIAFRNRRHSDPAESLLWIWIAVVLVVFSIPDQRDERYLLPAMPALAALCAIYWSRIPRWLFIITLVAVALITLGMTLGAMMLTRDFAGGTLYPWSVWLYFAMLFGFAIYGIFRPLRTRLFALFGVFFVYIAYAFFLTPFDGPLGRFDDEARAFARGRTIAAPVNHGSREEIFYFMLPGSRLVPYKLKNAPSFEDLKAANKSFIISLPLQDHSLDDAEGIRVVSSRLELVDRFRPAEMNAMLRGNISPYLFRKNLLVEVLPPSSP